MCPGSNHHLHTQFILEATHNPYWSHSISHLDRVEHPLEPAKSTLHISLPLVMALSVHKTRLYLYCSFVSPPKDIYVSFHVTHSCLASMVFSAICPDDRPSCIHNSSPQGWLIKWRSWLLWYVDCFTRNYPLTSFLLDPSVVALLVSAIFGLMLAPFMYVDPLFYITSFLTLISYW